MPLRLAGFLAQEICICESLPRLLDKTYERVRKSTKTGSVRFLEINEELAKVLKQVLPARKNPEELVFKNPMGTNHVDCRNFRHRWTKVLAATSIPYRRPHIIRHSFASHAIDAESRCASTAIRSPRSSGNRREKGTLQKESKRDRLPQSQQLSSPFPLERRV